MVPQEMEANFGHNAFPTVFLPLCVGCILAIHAVVGQASAEEPNSQDRVNFRL